MYSRSQTTIFQFLTQATELDPSVLQRVSVFGDIKRVHYRFPMQTAIMMFFVEQSLHQQKSSHSNMPLSFSAFGRLHWAWSGFTYQPQKWMGHQEVWLRDFAIPNKQCDQKSSYFEERAKLHPFLKMDSTLNFGEWDISTVSEPFISDMQTPPRMVPRLASWLVADPRKKSWLTKPSTTRKPKEISIEFDGFRVSATMNWRQS